MRDQNYKQSYEILSFPSQNVGDIRREFSVAREIFVSKSREYSTSKFNEGR